MSFLDDQTFFTRQIVDSVSDIIYVLDVAHGKIQFLNSRVMELLPIGDTTTGDGYTNFTDTLHPDDHPAWKDHISACLLLETGQACEVDVRLKTRQEGYRWFRIRNLVFGRSQAGLVSHLTGIIHMLNRHEEGRSYRPKGELPERAFLAVASGDYQETLRHIYVLLERIIQADAARFSNTSKAHLRRAQSMLQKLNLLTNDIVSYAIANVTDSRIQAVDLNQVAEAAIHDLQDKLTAAGGTIIHSGLPFIAGYPSMLVLLFHHLLQHSLRSRREGVPLQIRIYSPGEAVPPGLSATPGRSFVNVTFRDNGRGFDAAEKETLFEISSPGQEKLRYKGVGLAIVRRVMDIHKGIITAENIPGEGCAFACYFPA